MTTRVIQRTPDLGIKIKLQRQPEATTPCAPARVLDSEGAELARLGCGETYTCTGGGGGCPCEPALVWMRALPYRALHGVPQYLDYLQGGQAIDWRDDAPVTGVIMTGAMLGDWPAYELWAGVIGAHPAADIVWDYAWDGEEASVDVRPHAYVIDPATWEPMGPCGPTAQVVHGYQSGTLTVTASVDGVVLDALVLQVAVV